MASKAEIVVTAQDKTKAAFDSAKAGLGGINSRASAAAASVQSLSGHLATMGTVILGGLGVNKIAALTDAYASLNARVALSSQGIGSAALASQQLFEIAARSRVGVESLSEVYTTLSRSASEMGASQSRVLGITETLSKAMTISGGSAESARAAMIQFGQGMNAGALRGEELNSVLEQAPRLAQALAEGMGQPVGALKTLAAEGKITTEVVFTALERMKDRIDAEFEQLPTTIGQAMTLMQNSLLQTIGVFDQANGISRGFAGGMVVLSENMGTAIIAAGSLASAFVLLRTSATAATVASSALALATGALGGPLGVLVTALGLGTAAWVAWRAAGVNGEEAVKTKIIESHEEIIRRIDQQTAKLRERNQLAGAPIAPVENQTGLDAAKEYTDAYSKYQAVINRTGQFSSIPDIARDGLIKSAGASMTTAFKSYSEFASALTNETKRVTAESRAAFMADYQSGGDKLAKQLADYDQKFLGKVSDQQRDKDLAAIRAKAPKTAETATEKAAAAAHKKNLQEQAKVIADVNGVTVTYMEDLSRYQVMRAQGTLSEEQYTEALTALIAKQPASKKLMDEQTETAKLFTKSLSDLHDTEIKRIETIEKANLPLAAQNQTLAEEVELIGLSEAAQYAVTQARLSSIIAIKEEQLAHLQNTEFMSREQIALEEEIRLLKERQGLLGGKFIADKAARAAQESTAAWKSFYQDLERGLTDSLFRAFESGKGFFETLWSGIKNLFKTTVLKLAIQGVVGSVLGGLTGTASADSGGSSLLGLANNASSLYSGVSNLVGVGSQVFAGTMSVANALGTVAANATGTGISGLLATNGAYGTAAAGSASAAAGGAMSALGAIPVWGWAAMAVVAVAAIFGGRGNRETTGGGIEGDFGSSGFSGNTFSTWQQDGGWFHSDRSGKVTGALDAATTKQFTQAYGAMQFAAASAAVSLGLSADAAINYSERISLQLGNDAAANEKAVSALFAGIGDRMATAVAPGLSALAKEGESASAALLRLSNSLTTANSWSALLGHRLFQVSLSGASAASMLADVFGGLEQLATSSKAYYEAFFSEGERFTQTQDAMTKALASVNLALPKNETEFRALAATLDQNTDAGRRAYAVLLAIAPEFAVAADLASKFAKETADKLIKTFTGNGSVVPALDALELRIDDFTNATRVMSGELSYINSVMGDSTSAVIGFNAGSYTLSASLTRSQLSAGLLNAQIEDLQASADAARIDFLGLGAALVGVDTETFVNTITLAFENLATRINGVLGDITAERIAVRSAALQIINPTVMTQGAINSGISAINTTLPGSYGVTASAASLSAADAKVLAAATASAAANAQMYSASAAISNQQSAIGGTQAAMGQNRADYNRYAQNAVHQTQSYNGQSYATRWEYDWVVKPAFARLNSELAVLGQNLLNQQGTLAGLNTAYDASTVNANNYAAALAAQRVVQAAAAEAAKQAVMDYASATQDFIIDASKSVGKLSKLREETVRYYEAQSKLADLMTTSAAGIRGTIAAYTFSQKTDEQKYQDLAGQFTAAYTMTQVTTGETLASYGDKLNALINPLLESLTATGRDNLIASYLAQAELAAVNVENGVLALGDYQQDSLDMLGSIDATLAALDASSQSAEKIISDAVNAGADKTADGLRAVIAAVMGASIPAFATGGYYAGGAALVGETGPEFIDFNSPGRVYTASQTRGMFAGGSDNTAVVAELRALRIDNTDMRAELRAIATATVKTAKLIDRAMPDGDALSIRAATA